VVSYPIPNCSDKKLLKTPPLPMLVSNKPHISERGSEVRSSPVTGGRNGERQSGVREDWSKKQNTASSESQNGLSREPARSRLATMLLKVAT
jgi:hypothetical protein